MTAQQILRISTKVFLMSALATTFLLPEAWAQMKSSGVPKYVEELPRVCGLVPYTGCLSMPAVNTTGRTDYYEVAVREKFQQILPTGFSATKVWAFGPAASPATSSAFHYPAATIVATEGRPVSVKWINDLKDPITGHFLPSLLPIDQERHWANPPQVCDHGVNKTDCGGRFKADYAGPVPIVVHLHGSTTGSESDGIPEAWWLPDASNIPAGYAKHGSDYCHVNSLGVRDCTYTPGAALFEYSNNQYPATIFFHDHTLGISAENVYSGMVGFYLLKGVGGVGGHDLANLPSGPYEIPLAIQDKSFNNDGSLFSTAEGNMMVVNGKTWPYLSVEPRKYRFRMVNGCDSRNLALSLSNNRSSSRNFIQIGADQGFLPFPKTLSQIYLSPGERADVIVDFSGLPQGSTLILRNNEEGGDLGQVMQIKVNLSLSGTDTSVIPTPTTMLPHRPFLPDPDPATPTRKVALFESGLGIVTNAGTGVEMPWDDPVTEKPTLGVTEFWDIYNMIDSNGPEDHPIHIHEAPFEVVSRKNIATGVTSPPFPGETGFKDTVFSKAGTITRIKIRFDIPGLFAWHCHIIAHEDDQMMRPLCVVDPTPGALNSCLTTP